MSKLSDIIIEEQESGKRSNLFSKDTTDQKAKHPSDNYVTYWRLCLEIINAAGEAAGKDKLVINFRDPAKRHNVKDVVNEKFGGELSRVIDKRNDNIRYFLGLVDNLNALALKLDIDQVTGMTLMGLLVDADIRSKFKYHLKNHLESNHPPFALCELPARDFRKTRG